MSTVKVRKQFGKSRQGRDENNPAINCRVIFITSLTGLLLCQFPNGF
jgi:hypothetical protein